MNEWRVVDVVRVVIGLDSMILRVNSVITL